LWSAIAFTKSGSAPIACAEVAFSLAATAAALWLLAKFRKYVSMPCACRVVLAFGVNREEKIPLLRVGDRRSFRQGDELVGAAREDHLDAWNLLQQLFEAERDIEHELGFGDAFALGAGIVSSVPWIDHDP